MIESAQTILGGMKNLNDWKCPYKAGGHEEKSKGFKIFEQKQKKSQCNDAQDQMKKTKNEKEPKPSIGGHRGPFYKSNPGSRNVWTKKFGI
jgi:hypothetical protein